MLKQAQGPANLHHKSWKQKDHLPNQKASKTAGGGDNFFEEVKGKKKTNQDFKKKNIVNSTRGSWQYKEEEENVLYKGSGQVWKGPRINP